MRDHLQKPLRREPAISFTQRPAADAEQARNGAVEAIPRRLVGHYALEELLGHAFASAVRTCCAAQELTP